MVRQCRSVVESLLYAGRDRMRGQSDGSMTIGTKDGRIEDESDDRSNQPEKQTVILICTNLPLPESAVSAVRSTRPVDTSS